jgi:arsenate reductase
MRVVGLVKAGSKKILFLCTENSARSQMAEGLMRSMFGDKFEVYSAGVKPKGVNPYAIRVMAEIGIDISTQRSKSIDEFRGWEFDYVVTVCDTLREICPFFPGKKIIHKDFEDPGKVEGGEEEKLEAFRKVRDEIREWITQTFS